MKRFLTALSIFGLVVACQGEEQIDNNNNGEGGETKPLTINLVTEDATDIEPHTATLMASISVSEIKEISGNAYFYYAIDNLTADGLKNEGSRINAGAISITTKSFSAALSGLEPATIYYYVASVSINGEDYLGNVKSFTSSEDPKAPSITGDASSITENSARLSAYANPSADMGNVTLGIVYSTDANPSRGNGVELISDDMDGNNKYTLQATNLSSGTKYYYRSFIHTQYGGNDIYGDIKSFQTLDFTANIQTKDPSNIGLFKATLNGNLQVSSEADLPKEVWFIYGNDNSIEDLKQNGKKVETSIGEEGFFSCDVSNLVYDTKYNYVACATVHDKEVYGDIVSFTTDKFDIVITTGEITAKNRFAATITGSIAVNNDESFYKHVWFTFDKSSEGIKENEHRYGASIEADGSFKCTISNLDCNTTYYYFAGATVLASGKQEDFFGDVLSFTTDPIKASISSSVNPSYSTAFVFATLTVEDDQSFTKSAWFLYGTDSTIDGLKERGTRVDRNFNYGNTPDFQHTIYGLNNNSTYYCVACAQVLDSEFYGEVMEFTTKVPPEGSVDMGVSVAWASCNLGATVPEGAGNLYAWAETEVKPSYEYDWAHYKWGNGNQYKVTKYCGSGSTQYWGGSGSPDGKNSLSDYDYEDDAARVNLGSIWRIPTSSEWYELKRYSTWEWTTMNGVKGQLVTSTLNGNTIFLPSKTEYWGPSLPSTGIACEAQNIQIGEDGFNLGYGGTRCLGRVIRPIAE